MKRNYKYYHIDSYRIDSGYKLIIRKNAILMREVTLKTNKRLNRSQLTNVIMEFLNYQEKVTVHVVYRIKLGAKNMIFLFSTKKPRFILSR